MGGWAPGRALCAFARFAFRYWILVFPVAHREVGRVERGTAAIEDPALRRIALQTLAQERGNLEGAASFAAFLPRAPRLQVIRALVAFQAIFDYVDSLAELPAVDSLANGRALHEALLVAVTPGRPHPAYYAHHPHSADGGYLRTLVEHCCASIGALPSHAVVQEGLVRGVERMIEYQALIHSGGVGADSPLAAWGCHETPPGSGLQWWETAAGGASSLVAFALVMAAARPDLSPADARAIERAYFPWIGSLHVLLDSLIDLPQDVEAGHHSLVENYRSAQETSERMDAIAAVSVRAARALPGGGEHALLLAGMTGFYLAADSARLPHAADATARIAATFGELARPVLLVHRVRRWVKQIAGGR